MVTYQQFVALVFDVARDRGREVSSLEESQEVLAIAADLWSSGKPQVKNLRETEAREYIEANA